MYMDVRIVGLHNKSSPSNRSLSCSSRSFFLSFNSELKRYVQVVISIHNLVVPFIVLYENYIVFNLSRLACQI
jgi:hypothetical protein